MTCIYHHYNCARLALSSAVPTEALAGGCSRPGTPPLSVLTLAIKAEGHLQRIVSLLCDEMSIDYIRFLPRNSAAISAAGAGRRLLSSASRQGQQQQRTSCSCSSGAAVGASRPCFVPDWHYIRHARTVTYAQLSTAEGPAEAEAAAAPAPEEEDDYFAAYLTSQLLIALPSLSM